MSFKERYLRGDCSIDMVNDYVEMWHGEGEIKKTLSGTVPGRVCVLDDLQR